MMMFVTINDETQEFLSIDAIEGCMAVDPDKAVDAGYHAIILTADSKIGTPLTPGQLRDRINNQLRCEDCPSRAEPCFITQ